MIRDMRFPYRPPRCTYGFIPMRPRRYAEKVLRSMSFAELLRSLLSAVRACARLRSGGADARAACERTVSSASSLAATLMLYVRGMRAWPFTRVRAAHATHCHLPN